MHLPKHELGVLYYALESVNGQLPSYVCDFDRGIKNKKKPIKTCNQVVSPKIDLILPLRH